MWKGFRGYLLLAFSAILFSSCRAHAQPAAAKEAAFGFSGYELYKIEPGLKNVRFADMNGDGLNDIVVVNNTKAHIEILLQRKEADWDKPTGLEDLGDNRNKLQYNKRFLRAPFLTEKKVHNLTVEDFNGDGKPDMAFYGDPKELTVAYNTGFDKDAQKVKFRLQTFNIDDGVPFNGGIVTGDLNGDKLNDLVLLGDSSTYLFLGARGKDLGQPDKLPNITRGLAVVFLEDMDGNGRNDLVYIKGNDRFPLKIRLQDKNGKFGPTSEFETPNMRSVFVKDWNKDKRAEIFYVAATSGRFKAVGLSNKIELEFKDRLSNALSYTPGSETEVTERGMALGDLDGDGRLDLVLSEPAKARLSLFFGKKDGGFEEGEDAPSLSAGSDVAICDADGDGRNDVVVSSADEKTVSIGKIGKNREWTFPRSVMAMGKALGMDAADINGDGKCDIAALFENENNEFILAVRDGAKPKDEPVTLKLEASGSPKGLRILDADGTGAKEIFVFTPFEAARMVRWENRELKDVSNNATYQKGLTVGAGLVNFTSGDFDQDGKPELLIAQKNYVRALKLKSDGSLEPVGQVNSEHPAGEISGALIADTNGDNKTELIMFNNAKKAVEVYERTPGGFEFAYRRDTASLNFIGFAAGEFSGDRKSDILAVGLNFFSQFTSGGAPLSLEELGEYETEVEKGRFGDFALGDFNHDGAIDVVIADTNEHYIEIIERGRKDELRKSLKFKVFETKSFRGARDQGEPREVYAGDVTGDGKDDLVLLVHDKIIVYPQQ
ncbi:MAG: hypothetical protein GMKNLPBB_00168 [Myxococcota bacterium]|nr:hypothetical protein [Myxococcota bacterium]